MLDVEHLGEHIATLEERMRQELSVMVAYARKSQDIMEAKGNRSAKERKSRSPRSVLVEGELKTSSIIVGLTSLSSSAKRSQICAFALCSSSMIRVNNNVVMEKMIQVPLTLAHKSSIQVTSTFLMISLIACFFFFSMYI